MDFSHYVKCIFGLLVVFWKSIFVASIECEIGRSQQKANISVSCSPASVSEKHGSEESSCQLFSCRKKETVNWSIIDKRTGKLKIRFRGPPKHCDFQAYVAVLEIYDERVPYEEDLMCSTDNASWIVHSRRQIGNIFCSNCSSQPVKTGCNEMYTAHFNYIYKGLYRLKVIPYVNGSTRQAQRSYRFKIDEGTTNYAKRQFAALSLNASLQYRSVSQELDLGIPLLIEQPPEAVKIEIKLSSQIHDLYDVSIYSNSNASDIVCEDNSEIPWPWCQMHKAVVNCKFFNLTQGAYVIYVSFKDDRCVRGTVWTMNHNDSCFWVINQDFIAEETVDSLTPENVQSESGHILYTSIIIVVLIGAILTSFIAKRISRRKKEFSHGVVGAARDNSSNGNTEHTYNFTAGGYSNRFNFGQFLTLTEKPKPEVLLLYARETPPFMELLACLRRVLSRLFKCVVYDYFDPDLWNEVSTDSKGWIEALIIERQAKVIVVSSELGVIQYKSIMGECPPRFYKTPHPFDHLFSYAIRLIRDVMDENSYKNLFVITFDGITEDSHLMEFFNPYTRFVLPKHLYKLLEHLHEPDILKNIDVHRLEEKPEVRQLRMQLDHLKNLKLFGNIDADSRSLCS